jgi:dihydroorotate dehydrogenase (fumarate)
MNLRTTYLGFELEHPLMVGASPIVDHLDLVRRAEDAGAAAIVMHSLFEEQLRAEEDVIHRLKSHFEANAESATFLPNRMEYVLGPDAYLERLRLIKAAVRIPVIGSLNGVTDDGWLHYAKLIEEAGADALELNVYSVGHDPERNAEDVERETVDMVRHVCRETRLPVAVKLSPFYKPAPRVSFFSIGSTSPTSTPSASSSIIPCTFRKAPSCFCACDGWPSSPAAPACRSRQPAAYIGGSTLSRPSWRARTACKWCPRY